MFNPFSVSLMNATHQPREQGLPSSAFPPNISSIILASAFSASFLRRSFSAMGSSRGVSIYSQGKNHTLT